MFSGKIIASRGTGKTHQLMFKAKESNGIFVCSNTRAYTEKEHGYNIVGLDIVSYKDFIENMTAYSSSGRPVYIDELDNFLAILCPEIKGYTLTIDD